ncbi:hypothetical protein GGQ80_002096 [Sphingomonas jinjuensis]|uniref:Uncharacterized protein n=1 Tax=Sphingomonas jinjuensis TaxID=535907 RepID=A0A840FD59_9SPHN|nr:hypothetical protein [Sphingomonas jinjuensis]MBB4154186.1 hypothetical protein [Sphingomonas jinjuensis]
MDQVARLPLGGRRFQPLSRTIMLTAPHDLSAAAFRLQVRETPNAPGAPLVDLRTVGDPEAEGIIVLRSEERGRSFRTTIAIRVAEATMAALPYFGEQGDDVVLAYDLQVTPVGGDRSVWLEGEFWALAAVSGADGASDPGGLPGVPQQRPNFGGSAQFQIGTSIVEVTVSGAAGPAGRDAATPDRVDITATQGQTRFPAEGDFSDPKYAFSYTDAAVIELNGEELGLIDFTAPGGVAPIVLTSGADAGDIFTVHSFKLVGPDPSTALDRFMFSIGKSARQKMSEQIALDDAWQRNDPDHNNALASLMSDGYRRLLLPGTRFGGLDKSGDYYLDCGAWTNPEVATGGPNDFDLLNSSPGNVRSGTFLEGDGPRSTRIYNRGKGYILMGNSRSGDPNDNLADIGARRVGFYGSVETNGFVENNHLCAFAGVTGLTFELCGFFGWQGDALYVSHGFKPTDVAQNFDLRVMSSLFDGILKQNRNAISAESIARMWVAYSTFMRMTLPGMPGPIDIEPLRNTGADQANTIKLLFNAFRDFTGAAMTGNLGPPDHYAGRLDILMQGNTIEEGVLGFDVNGGVTPATIAGQANDHNIQILHNHLRKVSKPMRLRGACGVEYRGNQHEEVDAILLGNLEGYASRRVTIDENRWLRGGLETGATLLHDDTTIDCSFSRNELVDCGLRSVGASVAIIGRKGDVELRVNDNRVSDPNKRLAAFAAMGNEVGVISPKSEKTGNQFPDGAPPSAGNFNPPPPVRGVLAKYVSDQQEVIQPGQAVPHDVPCPGATIGMTFRAYFPARQPSATDLYITSGVCRAANVVRFAIENVGTVAMTIATGTTLLGVEEA